MRMILRFGKNPRLRFISHLDLQRFFQRALNRSGLPIAYSQGFNPHPVMAFASALALGWTSEYELLDVKMAVPIGRKHAEDAMRSALPQDLPVISVKMVDDRAPSLMPQVAASEYIIQCPAITDEMIKSFLATDTVMAMRKTKSGEKLINIRPLAIDLHREDNAIKAVLALTQTDTLKPDLLVKTILGAESEDISIHRTTLLGRYADGALTPLMNII